jgi:hypothetical protein
MRANFYASNKAIFRFPKSIFMQATKQFLDLRNQQSTEAS